MNYTISARMAIDRFNTLQGKVISLQEKVTRMKQQAPSEKQRQMGNSEIDKLDSECKIKKEKKV